MTDRGPRARKGSESESNPLKAEARRFLGTPMQHAMIRGLEDVERCEAWLAVGNELRKEGEIGSATLEKIATKLKEAKE